MDVNDKNIETLDYQSQPLKVLSPSSFYIHESILYSLEISPDFRQEGFEDKKFFGVDKEFCFEYEEKSKGIPKTYKNSFEDL